MHRRDVLKLTVAGGAAGLLPGGLFANTRRQQSVILIRDIDPGVSAEKLDAVLAPLQQYGLPVSCILRPQTADGEMFQPDSALARLLGGYAVSRPGTFELVPDVPELAKLSAYFRARAVFQVKKELTTGLWSSADAPESLRFTSVACQINENPLSPEGVRSAGIRNVYGYFDADMPTRAETWPDGTVRLIGGRNAQVGKTTEVFWQGRQDQFQNIVVLSALDFARTSTVQLSDAASGFAQQALLSELTAGQVYLTLSETQLRDDFKFARSVGLHFFTRTEGSDAPSETLTAFRRNLADVGIPSSYGSDVRTSAKPASGYWIETEAIGAPSDPDDALTPYREGPDGALIPSPNHTSGLNPGQAVRFSFTGGLSGQGLDDRSQLHLDTLSLDMAEDIKDVTTTRGPLSDFVIAVSESVLDNGAVRNALKKEFLAIASDGASVFRPLTEHVTRILPQSAEIEHSRRTTYQLLRSTTGERLTQDELLADARHAWSYFENWTNPETGLISATVNSAKGSLARLEAVTMWDIGSHINALMAAVDLELISKKSFQTAIGRILPNIVGRNTDGRQLPSGWIRTDRFKWGNRNFDGCDAGRLLAALHQLEHHPLAGRSVADLVTSWDLSKIIINGEIQSVTDRKLHTTYKSHCAHYSALAFRRWGHTVSSPYEVFDGKSAADGQMALLETAGRIGPLGAEPLVLEAIELGMSSESAYLADVLFAAQASAHELTGRQFCVSESPLDHPPWFTYQGLQINAPGIKWISVGVSNADTPSPAKLVKDTLLVNSKSAYLWAAYNRSEYAIELLHYVRERALGRIGFAAAVHEKTGIAPRDYSDINTNAIILQSINHMINKGR
ncbi:DUF3131 domain-containing protein [Aestuariicoccus sp. MJ-SS9]|uniref:DUF3131 domain-containing protein n=1 Tax=Aestuariicoccus sp. MJ-SS9 TaxID=3079855 RepID=UPI00290BB25C|nr:DUF3131 domain-containing protein [Aestuariicoccus sp. MJ-SS9]MDU8913816.1 DUF3131 domain-containing protein [Aestuariicoccus sp. MJ-SS9]